MRTGNHAVELRTVTGGRRPVPHCGIGWLLLVLVGCGVGEEGNEVRPLELRLEARFGSAGDALSLRAIHGITPTLGNGDSLFVVQRQVPSVLILSGDGDSLSAIGRAGSGPGEFSAVASVTILADTIWIADANRIISRFSPEGEFLDQLRFLLDPLGDYEYTPQFVAPLPDGTLLFHSGYGPGSGAAGQVSSIAYVRVTRSGEVLDTVVRPSVTGGSFAMRYIDGARVMGRHPVDRSDRVAVDPRGRWVVVGSTVNAGTDGPMGRLTWVGMEGDTLMQASVRSEERGTDEERQRFIDRQQEVTGRSRGEVERVVSDQVPWPETHSPIQQVFADLDGRVWVGTTHERPDSTRWVLVNEEGSEEGTFTLGSEVELSAASGSAIWGWTRGTYDEPYILRFSLSR